jgi:hypothetical protein
MTAIPHPIASATPDDGRRVWLLALAGAAASSASAVAATSAAMEV